MAAALIFNGHASPARHEGLCRHITCRGGAVVLVRPPQSPPHPVEEGHPPGRFRQMTLDASRPDEVARAFEAMLDMAGHVDLVLFEGVSTPVRGVLDWTAEEADRSWRGACLAAFVVGRHSVGAMLPAGRGTVLFIGQTEEASLRGPFSMGQANKAGMRALAQSMARAFGPRGIHVAHLALHPGAPCLPHDGLGELCWQLHQQHRSAWTHEMDLG
jgi:NAD(P)-dependent dehydrogenase (short-subunit alcohol dehydrogenase family)